VKNRPTVFCDAVWSCTSSPTFRRRQYVPPQSLSTSTRLHGVTSQKTVLFQFEMFCLHGSYAEKPLQGMLPHDVQGCAVLSVYGPR
jgi:hypothetical protein